LLKGWKDHVLSRVFPVGFEILTFGPRPFLHLSLRRGAGCVRCYGLVESVFNVRSHVLPSSREALAHPLAQQAEIFAKCWSEWQDLRMRPPIIDFACNF